MNPNQFVHIFFQYNSSDDAITQYLCKISDGRIIWGGDETIKQFKRYSTKPKVKDLYFTDKVSLSIINIEDINDFENDYKTMDCSYMESVWWTFKQIFDKGKKQKPKQRNKLEPLKVRYQNKAL